MDKNKNRPNGTVLSSGVGRQKTAPNTSAKAAWSSSKADCKLGNGKTRLDRNATQPRSSPTMYSLSTAAPAKVLLRVSTTSKALVHRNNPATITSKDQTAAPDLAPPVTADLSRLQAQALAPITISAIYLTSPSRVYLRLFCKLFLKTICKQMVFLILEIKIKHDYCRISY